jgi:hypothetical protein
MEIKLIRDIFTEHSTTGKLFVDGVFECFTLEDKFRGLKSSMTLDEIAKTKVYGKTAIPTGRYQVTTSESGLFHRVMPLLLKVPGYEYIRIHPGNSEEDTLGCILLGEARTADWISNSRASFNKFYPKLEAALKREEKVFITVE